MEILIGGQPSETYSADGGRKTYVDMQLFHVTSYDCEYEDETPHGTEKSTWPVTPFQVRCRNLSSEHQWAELHLDGEKVDMLFAKPHDEVIFTGFKNQGKLQEFLFALPRNQRVTDGDEVAGTSRLALLGSVQARFYSATYSHEQDQWNSGKSSGTEFRQANKIEAAKVGRQRAADGGADSMTGTARAGRDLGRSDDSMAHAGHKRVAIWNKSSEPVAQLTVHYRQKHVLQSLGLMQQKQGKAADEAVSHLLTKVRETISVDWRSLLPQAVLTAGGLHLAELPDPPSCYPPPALAERFIKFTAGDSAVPRPGPSADADQHKLSAKLGGRLHTPVDDANNIFSAAAAAMFGAEDLYFLVRQAAAADAAKHPERYSPDFVRRVGEGSAPLEPNIALQAIANATGVHWLLQLAGRGGDDAMAYLFRPATAEGKSQGKKAFQLCRVAGRDGPLHLAALTAADAADMDQRHKKAVTLVHSAVSGGSKRRRAEAIELE